MSETVRDAVFGNVGTMISFRVSADDSPILAKQFEPQFEPNDLLQMHNRNFIINMVINGEKSPAFSAKTLNLPPAQTDNTLQIIQNTRELYGQPRDVIERSIDERILPPENLIVKRPGPAYTPPKSEEQREADRLEREAVAPPQGKQWPISNVTPDEVNTALQEAKQQGRREPNSAPKPESNEPREPRKQATVPADTSGSTAEEPRKKRSRNRKRKPEGENNQPNRPRIIRESESNPQPARPIKKEDPTVLNLR
jgi:hypothetical protein